ncbi:uncharacterized protein LOC135473843 isoform X2 [Liolophura sinensis]|uniref:uncharacterized protein LOC135473843 isoform X2 n=1 Tax=Liolophura sinensis TaxID=3198878 RepID=UPI003158C950
MSQPVSDGLLQLVRRCNSFSVKDSVKTCKKFFVEGKQVGLIRSSFGEQMKKFPDTFTFSPDGQEIHLSDSLTTVEQRTDNLDAVLQKLRQDHTFMGLRGWRDEKYDVRQKYEDKTLLRMERSATSLFGVLQYGTHINGYTYRKDGQMMMWIARRSPTKPTWPGKLDNMCAGGLASGLDVLTCAKKECEEEASVSSEQLEKLKAVGTISYFYQDERGLFPETQFLFDLELPSDFTPVNADGEVAGFQLLSIPEVRKLIVSDSFKPNCALVIMDFLIRWGFVSADNEPHYAMLVEGLHYPLQSVYS